MIASVYPAEKSGATMRNHPIARRPKVYKPFPDAVAEGYTVVSGPGGVSFTDKQMCVPLTETAFARMVRLHEMGHLKFTPPQSPDATCIEHGITMNALQCCEDARVNTLLEHHTGFPMTELGETEDLTGFRQDLTKMLAQGDRQGAIKFGAETRVALQSRNANALTDILYDLSLGEAITLAERALEKLEYEGEVIPFARTIEAARILSGGLRDLQTIAESPGNLPSPGGGSTDFVPWGKMTVEQPPLATRFGVKISPRNRMSDSGIRLRHVSRILTDGRCFSHRVRLSGGSLLIDGSGSMEMGPDDVQQILKIAPLAWVAIYGANSHEGTLKILARDGKAVAPDDMDSPGGCNVIDGPALHVLAKQSTPRIWICDGIVTGVGDMMGWGNTVECAAICTAANIRRIETVAESITYLQSLARAR